MTTPDPILEPLLNSDRLSSWAQERPLLDPDFADLIIDAVSTLLREFGDPTWTPETLPSRARDIGYIVAKDYYLNPRQLRQETTGPLQESANDTVLNGINLTEAQKLELAGMVTTAPSGGVDGLWSLPMLRGDDSTIYARARRPTGVIVYDTRGEWPIEYLDSDQNFVFEPEA